MTMAMKRVTVRVPATTANLGPGFDCLGMALDIWNQVRFEPGGSPGVSVEGHGAGDGMKVDTQGNLYTTGPGGLWVYDPSGALLGRIRPPEPPSNMAWGDADWQGLYITARTSLYKVRMQVAGIPVGPR